MQNGASSMQDTILQEKLDSRMADIDTKILVLSGKGGVGKSMLAANLAVSLATKGFMTGLLDIDLHGPSIPGMLGIESRKLDQDDDYDIIPFDISKNLRVVSIGMMLAKAASPVVWRGPRKFKAIRQLLRDVTWGKLDVLVMDAPPGTGDEAVAVSKLAGDATLALIVTTSQRAALADVRRCIEFCKKSPMRVAGVVENMSGQICPHCGAHLDLYPAGGGKQLAAETDVPFLGSIPVDPIIAESIERGTPFVSIHPESVATQSLHEIIAQLPISSRPLVSLSQT